jgi:hypothetical protein
MNYIPQYHQQFVRIYNLIKKTIGKDYPLEFAEPPKTMFGYIELISDFMTSKNKKGKWVLEEASKEYFRSKSIINSEGSKQVIWQGMVTLRDLFRTNCIPANDSDIDNDQIVYLSAIKW